MALSSEYVFLQHPPCSIFHISSVFLFSFVLSFNSPLFFPLSSSRSCPLWPLAFFSRLFPTARPFCRALCYAQGDWHRTKDFIHLGRDWIVNEVKAVRPS